MRNVQKGATDKEKANQLNIKRYQGGTVYEKKKERNK